MYQKTLESVTSKSEELAITKDERYELIAQIVENLNESNESPNFEDKEVWDSNDTLLNFGEIVNHYN